jgi:branched-chain amino acid transport system substrate-binding protein
MRLAAALALGVLLLVACEGEDVAAPPPAEEPGTVPAPGPVRVGLLYTVSGVGQGFAQAALGAAALAEAEGRARGVEIEIVDGEYGGDPARATEVAERLAGDGVAGIVVASDDPALGAELSGFDAVPLVHALVAADGAVSPGGAGFRVAPPNRLQAATLARFLVADRGYDRVAILHERSPFGNEGAGDLERAVLREGAEVVLRQDFRIGGDTRTALTHAHQLEADALVLWTRDAGEAGRITIEAHDAEVAYQLVVSGNLATFDFGKNASSQVTPVAFREGILSVGTWAGPWFDLDRLTGFYERFRRENDAVAEFQAIQIHDAVLLLGEAAGDAGTDPTGLKAALERTTDFVGAGVPLSFSPDDHEGVGPEDMAILAFTKDPRAAGGEFAPDLSTGGGFFTINARSVELPPDLAYLLEEVSA